MTCKTLDEQPALRYSEHEPDLAAQASQRMKEEPVDLLQLSILLVIAGICAAIAQWVVGFSPGGFIMSIILGVVGAYLGMSLASLLRIPLICRSTSARSASICSGPCWIAAALAAAVSDSLRQRPVALCTALAWQSICPRICSFLLIGANKWNYIRVYSCNSRMLNRRSCPGYERLTADSATGSATRNVVPFPLLLTESVPPWRSMMP